MQSNLYQADTVLSGQYSKSPNFAPVFMGKSMSIKRTLLFSGHSNLRDWTVTYRTYKHSFFIKMVTPWNNLLRDTVEVDNLKFLKIQAQFPPVLNVFSLFINVFREFLGLTSQLPFHDAFCNLCFVIPASWMKYVWHPKSCCKWSILLSKTCIKWILIMNSYFWI